MYPIMGPAHKSGKRQKQELPKKSHKKNPSSTFILRGLTV